MTATAEQMAGLRSQVRDFYDDYAILLDEMKLEEWVSCFTEDGRYRVTSAENYEAGLDLSLIMCNGHAMLADRVSALRTALVYEPRMLRHLVSGVKINQIKGHTLFAQGNFAIFESLSDRETHVFMVGRYIDELIQDGTSLKIKQRVCVYDNFRVRTSLVIPV